MGRPPLKLEGQKFGKLLVTGSAGVDPRRRCSLWICSCDCGTVETTYGAYLTLTHTRPQTGDDLRR